MSTFADDDPDRVPVPAANPDGPGLSGLIRRIGVVDGKMRVHSPAGGPTRVEIELPTSV